jgi:beta-1,4-N-acetylglucosaminyltransferase
MTRVFVTVGTTRFPSLVRFFDRPSVQCHVVIQHADPDLALGYAEGFGFSPAVRDWYTWADVIVTHAGAGSVYDLLEQGRRIVVVPNLDRADTHQLDLAGHVDARRYAMMVRDLSRYGSVDQLVAAALRFEAERYTKTPFFKADFLLSLLRK